MSLALLFHHLLLNMFRMLINPSSPPQLNQNVTPTHIEPGMCKLIYKTSEYVQETLSKTYHTQRKLNNHKTPHQPTFEETRFLKQPRTSRLSTRH